MMLQDLPVTRIMDQLMDLKQSKVSTAVLAGAISLDIFLF